jgi:hypothetical protein
MTGQRGFSRTAAVLAVGLAIGVCAMLLATGARAKPAASPAKAATCHITLTHSVGGGAATKVRWVNDGSVPVGVYWLNYTGFLVYYESIAPHASFTQTTFRSQAWVMLNGAFDCVGFFDTSNGTRYVIR